MHSWAEHLKKLQSMQLRIASLQVELEKMPEEKRKVEERYASESSALKSAEEALRELELKVRSLDSEIEVIRTKKRDFQAKSALIKSNDEYRAAMLQIEMCDASISSLEDQQLSLMEAMDGQRPVIEERRRELEAAKANAGEVVKSLDARAEEIRKQIATWESRIPEVEAMIAPEYLKEYVRLRSSKLVSKTQPVFVPVMGESCGGCRLRLVLQVQNNARNGKLVFCPACQAMLYWDD